MDPISGFDIIRTVINLTFCNETNILFLKKSDRIIFILYSIRKGPWKLIS